MEMEKCKQGTKVMVDMRNGGREKAVLLGPPEIRGKGHYVQVGYVDDKGKATGKTGWKRPSELTKR
jgi:hypothetical protein